MAREKARALAALAEGATIAEAAKAAGIHRQTLLRWRQSDEAFAVQVADAIEAGTDVLEDEARRRALDKSDILLMFLLKKRRPEFRDSYRVEHSGGISVTSPVARALRDRVAADPEFASRLEEIVAGLREEPPA